MRRIYLALLAALVALPACKSVDTSVNKAEGAIADVLIPPSEEKQLGLQLQPQIEGKSKLIPSGPVVDYVRMVGQKVASQEINPDKWQFTFKVIDDDKTVNAFAIPGGTIYVYTGLLKTVTNEAELAGVLGHEAAHVTSRHVAKRMVAAYGLEGLSAIALGKNPNQLEAVAANVLAGGYLLKNSREDEAEADSKGVVAMSKAGYDPNQLVAFFQTLQKQEGNTPRLLGFLSDHPLTADRIAALQQQIRAQRLTGTIPDQAQFQAIQRAVP